jgi:hypothetical protein
MLFLILFIEHSRCASMKLFVLNYLINAIMKHLFHLSEDSDCYFGLPWCIIYLHV